MHDINLIDHAVTFSCGIVVGAIIMLVIAMVSKMFSQRRENIKQAYDRTVALVELDQLAEIRECLRKWSQRNVNLGYDETQTKDLIHWIDEHFLNQ